MKIKFKYKNLDKPNKNGHLYTKECMDKLFMSDNYLAMKKFNTLFLSKSVTNVMYYNNVQITDIVGLVKLENKYPELIGEVTIIDTPEAKEFTAEKLRNLFCSMYASCDDMEFIDDFELIKNINLKCLYLSDTCAFDYEQEIIED